jgi:hypothetical protein
MLSRNLIQILAQARRPECGRNAGYITLAGVYSIIPLTHLQQRGAADDDCHDSQDGPYPGRRYRERRRRSRFGSRDPTKSKFPQNWDDTRIRTELLLVTNQVVTAHPF